MFNVLVVFSGPILVFGVVVLFWFTLWLSPCRLYGLGLVLELGRVPILGLGLGSGPCRLGLASFCFVRSCPVLSCPTLFNSVLANPVFLHLDVLSSSWFVLSCPCLVLTCLVPTCPALCQSSVPSIMFFCILSTVLAALVSSFASPSLLDAFSI